MKKLMIAAAIVCAAALSQAATVNWQSGVVFTPSDAAGTINPSATYKIPDTATAAMYVWAFTDKTAFDKVVEDGIWNTYKDSLGTATASTDALKSSKFVSGDGGAVSGVKTGDYDANQDVYAAIIFTYTDGDGKDWYIENSAQTKISGAGGNATVSNLARYIGGASASGQNTWQSVPEPTSGLLLLLGVAGLALRRRRA